MFTNDVAECITSTQVTTTNSAGVEVTNTVWKAKNETGALALKLTGKKPLSSFFQIFCPLNSISSLLPSQVDLSVKLTFTSDERYFVTKNETKRPKLHVTEAKLYVMACLLESWALLKVENRLASGAFQFAYLCDVTKSYRHILRTMLKNAKKLCNEFFSQFFFLNFIP